MTEQANGWVQPEHRRCRHLHVSGQQCRGTARTGEKFCHTHQRFAETDAMYPVKVPLLEDPDSIRLVASQTVRALAVGTLPPANARSMLYGCRMALDLLLYEFARERFAAKQGDRERGDREQGTGNREVGSDSTGAEAVEAGKEAAPGDVTDADEVEAAMPAGPLEGLRIEPRFADLREQWVAAVARGERAVEKNLTRKPGEPLGAWRQRQRGPQEAGHPHAARCAGKGGDPGAVAREGSEGELPFDPQCPPGWRKGLMDGWLPEHIGAWYRAHSPGATAKEVRDFVRGMWDKPRADERAGWRWPWPEGEGAPAPEECLFWTMNEEEIAAWIRAEVPDTGEREAHDYAERRMAWMGELREKRARLEVPA